MNNRTVTNTYDRNNRLLVEDQSPQGGSTQPQITTSYAYDDGNNRTAKTVTGGSGAGTTAYTYNAFNQVTSYTNGEKGSGDIS